MESDPLMDVPAQGARLLARIRGPEELVSRRTLDREAEDVAARIIEDVRVRGEDGVREWAQRTGELSPGMKLTFDRAQLERAWVSLDPGLQALLEGTKLRVERFAQAQRASLSDLDMGIPGGRAGHDVLPVGAAGCYVPGGRYPLPSSAIMTVVPARVAGVGSVWCAGPKPTDATLGAAYIAGAEGFLAVGGAQAVAALAYGVCTPMCDTIVGPGGRYVAAAKRLLFGVVGTEAPAGPSELLILADGSANPEVAAADLLAQAEHDCAAIPAIVVETRELAQRVEVELVRQLATLPSPNRETARAALDNGWMAVAPEDCADFGAWACGIADAFAPEHLELLLKDPRRYRRVVKNAGAVFVGEKAAEVMGDYGAGPNHCLPTSGAARFGAGLSVFTFLRIRTWIEMEDPGVLASGAAALARVEGLEAHARAADIRAGRL